MKFTGKQFLFLTIHLLVIGLLSYNIINNNIIHKIDMSGKNQEIAEMAASQEIILLNIKTQ